MTAWLEGIGRQLGIRLRGKPGARPTGPNEGGQGQRPFGLSPRELEVLQLVAAGRTNRQIGTELFISENTAGVHVSNILGKLGVASRTEAASAAFQAGLVRAEPPNHELSRCLGSRCLSQHPSRRAALARARDVDSAGR